MMTTPRVTEIPMAMTPVEPDPFIDNSSGRSAAHRRLAEREARARRTDLVRRTMRVRAVNPRNP